MSHHVCVASVVTILFVLFASPLSAAQPAKDPASSAASPYAAWQNFPGRDANFFPIAVWLQAPRNAAKYKAIGINLYVGLWSGPNEEQIAELRKHQMPVICDQNAYALKHLDDPIIVGWMHGDEPDNAQSLGAGKGYGPPIKPEKIVEDYKRIKACDATRPVLLNLGQGVAWDGWYGRGVRTNHSEDYPEYAKGGDIVSFDIYPAVHDKPAIAGKLWYVPYGVERLRKWAGPQKPVWNCIECTRISNVNRKPTTAEVKAEVWMSLVHGSRGLVYFAHEFKPKFIEAGLLADEEMARAVGAINRQIQGLAPVLNGPSIEGGVRVTCEPPDVSTELAAKLSSGPVAAMLKKHGGATFLFAVRMEDKPVAATFQVSGFPGRAKVEVLGENRTLSSDNGRFRDEFAPHAVHLYRIGGSLAR
jgi:hypothetical protein